MGRMRRVAQRRARSGPADRPATFELYDAPWPDEDGTVPGPPVIDLGVMDSRHPTGRHPTEHHPSEHHPTGRWTPGRWAFGRRAPGSRAPGGRATAGNAERAPRRPVALMVAGLVVLTSLLSSAAARADAPFVPLAQVPVGLGAAYALSGNTLYTVDADMRGNVLNAYSLPSGQFRWSTEITVLSTASVVQVVGDVVLVSMNTPAFSGDHTVALDAATGDVLWRSGLTVAAVGPGTSGRDGRVYLASVPSELAPEPLTIEAVTADGGTPLWSYLTPAGCQYPVPYQVGAAFPALPLLCPGGELRTIDLGTGGLLRTLEVPGLPDPAARPAGSDTDGRVAPSLTVIGQQTLVGYVDQGSLTLTAYDTALHARWSRQLALGDYGAFVCGDALCVSNNGAITGTDSASGQPRWREARVGFAAVPGTGSLVLPSGHRLPIGSVSEQVVGSTGRSLLDLGTWHPAGTADGTAPVFMRADQPTGGTWFAVLDASGGSTPVLRTLGFAAAPLTGFCRSTSRYMACLSLDNTVRIWRYHT